MRSLATLHVSNASEASKIWQMQLSISGRTHSINWPGTQQYHYSSVKAETSCVRAVLLRAAAVAVRAAASERRAEVDWFTRRSHSGDRLPI
jgi:hypothetical protein